MFLSFVVCFAYDPGVVDLSSTKLFALLSVSSLWALAELFRGFNRPAKRLSWELPLFVMLWAFLPAMLRGVPTINLLDQPVYFMGLALTFVLLRSRSRGPNAWAAMAWSVSTLAWIVSLSAILEVLWFGGEPLFGGAPVSTFGNPNHLGAALVLMLPAVTAGISNSRHNNGAVLVAILTLFAITLTRSHLAMLGASAALGFFAASPHKSLLRRLMVLLLLLCVLVSGVLGAGKLLAIKTTPKASVAAQLEPGETEFSRAFLGRLYLYERGLEAFHASPLLGVGVGEYKWAFAMTQAEHLEANPKDGRFHTRLEHAHSDPLELFTEHGVLGVAAFLFGIWALRKRGKRDPNSEEPVPAFALAGLGLFMLLSLGHFALFTPQIVLFGLMYAACLPARRWSVGLGWHRALSVIVGLLVVLSFTNVVRQYLSERIVVSGLRAEAGGAVEEAEALYQRSNGYYPNGRAFFQLGTLRLFEGDLDGAIDALDSAASLLPYAEVHANLGLALCQRGYDEEALQRLEFAVRLDPGRGETRQALELCREATAKEPQPGAGSE